MAGMGPAPKPDHLRRRRNAPTISGTVLPARGRTGPTPKLGDHPAGEKWLKIARDTWREWWHSPPATQWSTAADRVAVYRAIVLFDEWARGSTRRGLEAELRLSMDGLGLTPKGRQQLRWTIADVDDSAPAHLASVTAIDSARGRSLDDPR